MSLLAQSDSNSQWQISGGVGASTLHYVELREWRDAQDRQPPTTAFGLRGVGVALQAAVDLDPDSAPRFVHRLEGGLNAAWNRATAPHPIEGRDVGVHLALFPFAQSLGIQPFLSLAFGSLKTQYDYQIAYQTGVVLALTQHTSHVTLAPGMGAVVHLIGPASLRLEVSEVAVMSAGSYSKGSRLGLGLTLAHTSARRSPVLPERAPVAPISDPLVRAPASPADTTFDSFTFSDTLKLDAAAAASRLVAAYEVLGVAIATREGGDLAVTSLVMRVRGRFAGVPLSRLFNCGQSAVGDIANTDEVEFRMSTTLRPLPDRTTLVRTALSAVASGDGNRGTTTRCNSTGVLEREIARRLAADGGATQR